MLLGRAVNVVPFLQREALAKSHAFHLAFTSLGGIAAYTAVVAAAARRRSGGGSGGGGRTSDGGGGGAAPPSSLPSFDDVDGLLIGGALALLALPLAAIAPIFGGFWAVKASAASEAAAAEAEAAAGGPPPAPPPELVPFQNARLGSPLLNANADDTLRGGSAFVSGLLVQDAFGDKTPLKTLRSVSFWLFFVAYSTGCGAGLTLINNAAALAGGGGGRGGGRGPVDPGPDPGPEAPTTSAAAAADFSGLLPFGGSPVFDSPADARDAVPLVVALFSISNCLGRLAAGRVPDRLLRGPSRVPRTVPFAALVAASSLAAALASAVPPGGDSVACLGAAAVAAGAAYGGLQGMAPAVVSEVFGLRHFGSNLALAAGAPALGSYVFATLVSGKLYERARLAAEAAGGTCSRDRGHGSGSGGGGGHEKEVFACFRGPLLAAAAAAGLLGLSAAVALALRTRRLYGRVAAVAVAQRAARGRLGEELAARGDSLRGARAEAALLRAAVCRAAPLVEELARATSSPPPSGSAAAAAAAAKRLSEELSQLAEETRRLLGQHDTHVAAVGDWGRRALAGGGSGAAATGRTPTAAATGRARTAATAPATTPADGAEAEAKGT